MSNSKRADLHGSLFVADSDDIKMRFYRAAALPRWPGRTDAAISIALWLIENMDWKKGTVLRHTSARHLMALTGLSRSRVDDGLNALIAAGLIERTYLGKGRRGSIRVAARVIDLRSGDCVIDLWPALKVAPIQGHSGVNSGPDTGPVDGLTSGPDVGPVSGPDSGPEWPRSGADYPIPSSPAEIPAAAGVSITTPTTEGSLPSSPHLSLLAKNLNNQSIAGARVAGATKKTQVAPATDTYGYGTPIAGLNGHTNEIVDQLLKLEGGIILDKDPAWTTVHEATRQTSPERVRVALLDIGVAKGAGKLRNRPTRVLRAFAAAVSQEDAVARLAEEEKPKPFRLIDHMGGGYRR